MATRKRTVGSLATELLAKSREAALSAVRVFNDPHVSFKSETFIVLMVIAWTYLLHAHYRRRRGLVARLIVDVVRTPPMQERVIRSDHAEARF